LWFTLQQYAGNFKGISNFPAIIRCARGLAFRASWSSWVEENHLGYRHSLNGVRSAPRERMWICACMV